VSQEMPRIPHTYSASQKRRPVKYPVSQAPSFNLSSPLTSPESSSVRDLPLNQMKKSSFLTYSFQIVGEKPTGYQRSFQKSNQRSSQSQKSISGTKCSNTNHSSTSAPKIEAVPQHLSLAPDRYYIKLLDGLAVPIQLTEKEARSLLPEVAVVRDRESVLNIVEGFLPSKGVQS